MIYNLYYLFNKNIKNFFSKSKNYYENKKKGLLVLVTLATRTGISRGRAISYKEDGGGLSLNYVCEPDQIENPAFKIASFAFFEEADLKTLRN
jgi:hypothetical protein